MGKGSKERENDKEIVQVAKKKIAKEEKQEKENKKDITKEEKKSESNDEKKILSKKVIIMLIAALLVIGGAATFLLLNSKNTKKIDNSVLFVENEQLKYFKEGMEKPIVILNEYDEEKNSALIADTSDSYIAYINEKNLYLYDILKKETNKIATNVMYAKFTYDGKNVIYYDDTSLIVYNIKNNNKNKLLSFEENEYVNIKQIIDTGFIYTYYSNEEEVYYYSNNDGSSKTKISVAPTGYVDTYYFSADYNKFYYFKEKDASKGFYMLYAYNFKTGENNRILDDVTNIYNNNIDNSNILNDFYYTTINNNELKIVNDDELGKDLEITNEEKILCTYSEYLSDNCSYDEWSSNSYYTVKTTTDKNKEVNELIRKEQGNYKLNDIYYYKDGKSELVVKDVTFLKNVNFDTKTIIYKKINQDNKVNMSSLKSLEDYKKYIIDNEIYYYKTANKDAVELKYYIGDKDKPNKEIKMHLFCYEANQYCKKEMTFIKELKSKYKNLVVEIYDVSKQEEVDFYYKVVNKATLDTNEKIPFTLIGTEYTVGFDDNTKKLIIGSIERQLNGKYVDYVSQVKEGKEISLNIISSIGKMYEYDPFENVVGINDEIITNNGYIYVLNTAGELYSVKTYSSDDIKLIDSNVNFLNSVKNIYNYYTTEDNSIITMIEDGKIGKSYEKSNSFFTIGNDYMLYTDCLNDYSCTLTKYNNGKLEKISDDVLTTVGNDLNSLFLVKNYNGNKLTVDIYYKNASKIEKVAFDVKYSSMHFKRLDY